MKDKSSESEYMHFFKTASVFPFPHTGKKKIDLNSNRAVRRNLCQFVWEGEGEIIPQAFLNYCGILESCCVFVLCPKNYSKMLGLQNDGARLASCQIVNCGNKRTAMKLKKQKENMYVCEENAIPDSLNSSTRVV